MVAFDKEMRDITSRLFSAEDITELIAFMAAALSPYGCDYFTFGGKLATTQESGRTFCYTNLPTQIMARNPNSLDFPLRRALTLGKDSFWTDENIWQDATPDEVEVRERFKSMGLQRGYTGGLSRQPGYYTGISFHLDGLSDDDLARDQIRPKLMAIAAAFDKVFLNNHMVAHFGLSPRERDVLTWLALGARPDEIATRLGIGPSTVDKYIVNAKEKLSARTRDHAVARALMLGLIHP